MPDELTQLRLDAISRRVKAASPGPWRAEKVGYDITRNHKPNGEATTVIQGRVDDDDLRSWGDADDNNAVYTLSNGHDRDFIAHARQDVPDLVSEVQRLKTRVTELEGLLREARDQLFDLGREYAGRGTIEYCGTMLCRAGAIHNRIDAALNAGKGSEL